MFSSFAPIHIHWHMHILCMSTVVLFLGTGVNVFPLFWQCIGHLNLTQSVSSFLHAKMPRVKRMTFFSLWAAVASGKLYVGLAVVGRSKGKSVHKQIQK